MPAVEPTNAIDALLLLHTPPGVAHDKVVLDPRQTMGEPVIAAGVVYTVNTTTETHPATAYVTVVVPAVLPTNVAAPVVALTVATEAMAGAETDQVPPGIPGVSVADEPAHTAREPLMAGGVASTV